MHPWPRSRAEILKGFTSGWAQRWRRKSAEESPGGEDQGLYGHRCPLREASMLSISRGIWHEP